jgi:hypothetical protein
MNTQEQDREQQQNESNRGQGPGRTSNPGNDNQQQSSDISQVDRQEGEMNHGELGGSMGQRQQEPAKEQQGS